MEDIRNILRYFGTFMCNMEERSETHTRPPL